MYKQQRPRHQTPITALRHLSAALLLCMVPITPHAASDTPPPIIDTEPPTNINIIEPGPTTLPASRPVITLKVATDVASSITATDSTQAGSPSSDITGYPTSTVGPMAPGKHTITWTATDLGNNSKSIEQNIYVLPEVNLAVDQTVGEGNSNVTVTAHLSGKAPHYPVTLPYTVSGTASAGGVDHNAVSGNIIINGPATSGSISFAAANDTLADANETVIFELTTPSLEPDRVIAGSKTRHTVTIIETNLAPIVALSAQQGSGGTTQIVTTNGGPVILTASANDPNGDTISNYDWSASDNALVPTSGTTSSSFTFNPAGLTPGTYTARITVSDNNDASSTRDLLLRVNATASLLSTTADSDDDGIVDSIEGDKDDDGDGIPNYLDAVDNPAWLPGWELLTYRADLKRNNSFVSGPITFSWVLNTVSSNRVYYPLLLATEPGLKLSVGPTARANSSNHGRINTTAASLHFGSTPGDTLVSADGQVVDIEISGLGTTGQSVYLVIPQAAALPDTSSFKIISAAHIWQDFTNQGAGGKNELLFILNKDSDNYCANPGGAYTTVTTGSSTLGTGVSCIELLIEDGGPNDYDGKANGVIRLLGAPFVNSAANNETLTTPPDFSGPAEGSVESLNKITLTQGGGGIGFINPWGVIGLLLLYTLRRRYWHHIMTHQI